MNTKRITWLRPDGGISIAAQDAPIPADWVRGLEINVTDIPTDRTFRNAWKMDLTVDMTLAREIHKNNLRIQRAPKLAALDIEYQKADEAGDLTLKKQIADKKKALRDITVDPRIAMAQTPEELKSVIPDALL